MDRYLIQVNDRHLMLALNGLIALVAAACLMYWVMPQIKTYNKDAKILATLETAAKSNQGLDQQLKQMQHQVAELERTLHGDLVNLPAKEMEAYIIGRLQTISWRNQIQLAAVEPKDGGQFDPFQEVLFNVELNGHYHDLFQWLNDAGRELGFVVIKEYAMQPLENSQTVPRLSARLTMASYRAAYND